MQPSRSRICVNARFVTQELTGVQRYAYNVVKRMSGVTLLSPGPARPEYQGLDDASLAVIPHFLHSHLWEQLVLPKVLHGQVLWSPTGIGPVAAHNQVLTIHDVAVLEHSEYYAKPYALWYRLIWPVLVRHVKKIITVSEFSKERIVTCLKVPERKVEVVYEGVDDRFKPQSGDQMEAFLSTSGIKRPYILAVGAISARKNYRRLLEAWQKIQGELSGVTLVLVGGGGFTFSTMSSLGALPPRTMHLGGVYDESLAALYAGALAFVYPSLYEGFGLPVLEAMSVGTPVVTSNNTSLPEIAGNAALFIDPFDSDSIAEGVKQIVDDEELRKDLRLRGLNQVKKYSWESAAKAIMNILQEE